MLFDVLKNIYSYGYCKVIIGEELVEDAIKPLKTLEFIVNEDEKLEVSFKRVLDSGVSIELSRYNGNDLCSPIEALLENTLGSNPVLMAIEENESFLANGSYAANEFYQIAMGMLEDCTPERTEMIAIKFGDMPDYFMADKKVNSEVSSLVDINTMIDTMSTKFYQMETLYSTAKRIYEQELAEERRQILEEIKEKNLRMEENSRKRLLKKAARVKNQK